MKIATTAFAATLLIGVLAAQDAPEMPKPQKEHGWLQQLTGEWVAEGEFYPEEGKPSEKLKGTESGSMLGGFFAVFHEKGEFLGSPFTGLMILGYDPEKKKYVGTWADSMSSYLWRYEGALDESRKILTLFTEGPCPQEGGRIILFKDEIRIESPDHKIMTSYREKDGKWVLNGTLRFRKKA